jgi:ABC-type dipeptide/oligopeptide/nickel transport system permease subunit
MTFIRKTIIWLCMVPLIVLIVLVLCLLMVMDWLSGRD